MTRKQTKKLQKKLLEKAKAEQTVEAEDFEHLLDPLEKYLIKEKEKKE